MDNGMNHPNYSRAEREHREPFESSDGDYDQCEECDGEGEVKYLRLDTGQDQEYEMDECEACKGEGQIFTPKLTRGEYAEKYEADDE